MAAGVLDDGEDTIFMGDSKFKQFMASVETITRGTTIGEMSSVEPDEIEQPNIAPSDEEALAPDFAAEPEPLPRKHTETYEPEEQSTLPAPSSPRAEPAALIQNGMQFLGQLAQTLSDPQATKRLVDTIVQKDEKTGQTFVKLPVENEQAVEGMLNLLGGLLKAMSGNS